VCTAIGLTWHASTNLKQWLFRHHRRRTRQRHVASPIIKKIPRHFREENVLYSGKDMRNGGGQFPSLTAGWGGNGPCHLYAKVEPKYNKHRFGGTYILVLYRGCGTNHLPSTNGVSEQHPAGLYCAIRRYALYELSTDPKSFPRSTERPATIAQTLKRK